jgi:dihydroorotase-like cyclic amidohydrolase
MSEPDIVLRGGRVIDPGSGLDAVQDVAVTGGQVTRVGDALPRARADLDVAGLVVTAGFVDLHSHVNDVAGFSLQALDGVTTALELEAGVTPVDTAYRLAAAEGRPVNYGFATSWALARMEAIAGTGLDGRLATFLANLGSEAWQRPASPQQITAMLARLAAEAGVPTFTHARDMVEMVPRTRIDGAEEIVRAAGETGAQMHYCHVNSTSQRHIGRVLRLVSRAQAAGARVSTEAYPYGSGMTGIGAAFLAPERLGERGLTPSSLTYAPTGERVGSEARLRELRQADPGGLVIIELLDENDPADRELLMSSLTFPGAIVASDAMPLTWTGPAPDPLPWPLPGTAITHPRTAGTFSRALRLLTRDGGPLGLAEALSKCSLRPARLLQDRAPAMRRKGRLQAGCDADIVVLDPATISDQASYLDSTRPSTGIQHVMVNGTFVVRDGNLVAGARPGHPIRADPR